MSGWGARVCVRAGIPIAYRCVAAGHPGVVLSICAPDVVTSTPGTNALGGKRRTRSDYRAWLRRLNRLTTRIRLRALTVEVTGSLNDLRVRIEWTAVVTVIDGRTFDGTGTQRVRLRWGRIISVIDSWDLATVEEICAHLAVLGVAESLTAPITA